MKVFDNLEAYAAEVGNEIGVSEWMVIDLARINNLPTQLATINGSMSM